MKKKGQMNMMVGLAIGVIIMIVVLGVIFAFIRDNTLDLTTITNESVDITSTSNTILLENITIASGLGTTGNTSVINIIFFGNSTNNTDMTGITIGNEVNWTIDGLVYVIQGAGTDDTYFADGTYNISYTYTTDGVGQAANDDIVSNDFFGNTSISTEETGIAFNSEVNVTDTGAITVKTHNFTDGTFSYTYQFEPSGYVSEGTTRTIISTLTILLAIVVLVFLAGFVSTRQ